MSSHLCLRHTHLHEFCLRGRKTSFEHKWIVQANSIMAGPGDGSSVASGLNNHPRSGSIDRYAERATKQRRRSRPWRQKRRQQCRQAKISLAVHVPESCHMFLMESGPVRTCTNITPAYVWTTTISSLIPYYAFKSTRNGGALTLLRWCLRMSSSHASSFSGVVISV